MGSLRGRFDHYTNTGEQSPLPLQGVVASAQDELVRFLREELQQAHKQQFQIRKDLVEKINIFSEIALTIDRLEERL